MLRVVTPLSEAEEAIVSECLGCAIAVHRELGPGFKEVAEEPDAARGC